MTPQEPRRTVLVVSKDPELADVRKRVLENAGFEVIPVTDLKSLQEACDTHAISLVMIGYSLPPSEKRRVWETVRDLCKAPILELHQEGKPDLIESHALFAHESLTPEDFLGTVLKLLNSN
jgi:DNA-binding response OmpR family regulator